MKKRFAAIMACLLSVVSYGASAPARATDSQSARFKTPMMVMGEGLESCGSLTQAYAESPSNLEWPGAPTTRPKSNSYLNWVLGYIAAAQRHSNTMLSTDSAGVEEWIKRYCAANPEKSVVQAAMAFDDSVISR